MRICKGNKLISNFYSGSIWWPTPERLHTNATSAGKDFEEKILWRNTRWGKSSGVHSQTLTSSCYFWLVPKGSQINLNSCCLPGGPFPWWGQVQVPLFRMWKALHTADQSENPPEKPPPSPSATSTAPWTTSIARRSRSPTPRPTRRGRRTACPTKLKRGF